MNFLPFVFTFLLLISLVSSFLFSSVLSSARETRIISLQNKAYLKLLSKQNIAQYKKIKEKSTTPPPPPNPKKSSSQEKEPRSENDGNETSKLNLMSMIHGQDIQLRQSVQEIAIRLLDLLYGKYDFYKGSSKAIIERMIAEKIDAFEELRFKDENLDKIYYKIVKGTNTGYPSLHDYFRISDKSPKPIHFKYTTKNVLRATLGEKTAQALFDAEKKRGKVLLHADFKTLITSRRDASISPTDIDRLFDFKYGKKGLRQIHQEGAEKIRAFHSEEANSLL